MITKTISKQGNSQCLPLDRALLGLVGLEVGSKVHIHVSGRSIVITPAEGAVQSEQFDSSLSSINDKYADLLKRLA